MCSPTENSILADIIGIVTFMESRIIVRRLAAVLAVDVAGFSRLVGRDEVGTLEKFASCRTEVIEPAITSFGGRIVKLLGDGILADFPSVVGATEAAVAMQRKMAERTSAGGGEPLMRLRIGITLGDVILDGDDILGDGVNIAFRVQGLAEPGGVCVTQEVRNAVRDKLRLAFAAIGDVELKNVTRPPRCYRVVLETTAAEPLADLPRAPPKPLTPRRWRPLVGLVAIGLAMGAVLLWQAWQQFGQFGSDIKAETEDDYHRLGLVYWRNEDRADDAEARRIWQNGLEEFPDSAVLRLALGFTYNRDIFRADTGSYREDDLAEMERLSAEARAIPQKPNQALWLGHFLDANIAYWRANWPRVLSAAEATMRIAPNDARARVELSYLLANAGHTRQAVAWAEMGLRADPDLPHGFRDNLGWALYLDGRPREALDALSEIDTTSSYLTRAATYARLGETEAAHEALRKYRLARPEWTISTVAYHIPMQELIKRSLLEDLRKAGLPE
jgi:class 3 adenylate cyclase/tetratricopeptide (TPR) repeat protein